MSAPQLVRLDAVRQLDKSPVGTVVVAGRGGIAYQKQALPDGTTGWWQAGESSPSRWPSEEVARIGAHIVWTPDEEIQ